MKITKLHIDNFGKLSNFNLEFNDGFTQIVGENGFGKTTISVFIKAMFYGMSAARENIKMERKKYSPWQGGNFGGFIEYETNEGEFRLTRFFGKTPEGDETQLINLKTNQIVPMPKLEIGEEIFGLGKETFEMTAFFPQLKFLSSGNNDISASMLGLDKFKYDLANLSQAVDLIKKKVSSLKKEKLSLDVSSLDKRELNNLKSQLLNTEEEIKKVGVLIKSISSELEKLGESKSLEEKQIKLQEELFQTKAALQTQLLEKSKLLNISLLQLEELKNALSELKSTKKSSLWILTLVVGIILTIVPIALFIVKIINLLPFIFTSICILGLTIALTTFLKLHKKINREEIIKQQNIKNQILLLENNVENLKSSMDTLNTSLDGYKNVENPTNQSQSQINEDIYSNNIQLEKLKSEEVVLLRNRDDLLEKIDLLQEKVEKSELLSSQIKDKIEILGQTKELLLQANENVSSRFIEPINNAMNKLLGEVNTRGRRFVVDTNLTIKEETSVGIKELEYSSQGYQDILSFCMRMYLVKEIFKKEKPFVVLDDTFVNLDDENFDKVKKLVKDFSKDNQIIYICCNSRCKF